MNDARYSLPAMARYFLKLGTIGFGGPVALVGYMYRDLVESRRWIGEDDYKEGLTLAQLMPGPLAAQLAMYLGYVHHGALGATIVGAAFVLPSFLMVIAIGWAYQRFGGERTSRTSTPAPRNSHTLSDCVHTVNAATARKIDQSSRLRPMFLVVSLYALIAMIPMTAAPTP